MQTQGTRLFRDFPRPPPLKSLLTPLLPYLIQKSYHSSTREQPTSTVPTSSTPPHCLAPSNNQSPPHSTSPLPPSSQVNMRLLYNGTRRFTVRRWRVCFRRRGLVELLRSLNAPGQVIVQASLQILFRFVFFRMAFVFFFGGKGN